MTPLATRLRQARWQNRMYRTSVRFRAWRKANVVRRQRALVAAGRCRECGAKRGVRGTTIRCRACADAH